MNFINYLSERPKLTQLGIVLIVFFILMSMTGHYHDLIIERHVFAKSVDKGEIQSSVGFAESMSMILNWQLPPQLVRIPELTFYHPVINTSATYVLIALLVTAGLLYKSFAESVNKSQWLRVNWFQIISKGFVGIIVGLLFIPTLYNWFFGEVTRSTFWEMPFILQDFSQYLIFDFWLTPVYDPEIEDYEDYGRVRLFTRAIGVTLLFLINLVRELLIGGFETVVSLANIFSDKSGWDWLNENKDKWYSSVPAIPWTVLTAGAFILGYKLKGVGLSILAGFSCIYLAVFGQWEPAMQTLSFVLVAAPVSCLSGVIWGVLAYKSRTVERVITPLLLIAQTFPHFAYLVPVIVFFGIGDHAGAVATIIFATPPMIRLTLLGLKRVSPEVLDAGRMSGCHNYQLMFKVLIPTARHDILIGVNQVIMQCLAMAVIASFIGAMGLGFNLLLALNQLRVGQALELGICIVLIAVVLDKLSLAWADKQTDYFADLSFVERNKTALLFVAVFFAAILFAWFGNWVFADTAKGINYFYLIPHNKGITTEPFWQAGVDYMVSNWRAGIKIFNTWLLVEVLMPMKASFLAMPAIATFVLTMGIGYIIGGIRSAIVVGLFMLFIALTPWWERALITMYMLTFAVIVSVVIGTIVGAICVQNKRATKFILLVCDTFQTFPSFIYLIPVIMLFGVTDTSVLIAVIVYAVIPPTRYTVEGLRNVPESLLDAADMSGVTKLQRMFKIEFPLAFPHIMLGVNQCVVFALFMVIIGAFIGTEDLGQEIMQQLFSGGNIGSGLMLGLCVAFIGLAVDHLIQTWATKRRKLLGID